MKNPPIIRMNDICFTYGTGGKSVHALQDITLSVFSGEFIAITGPSGSGKSTLMQIMGCMLAPTGGAYYLLEDKVSSMDKNTLAEVRNRRIGFVFQSFNLLARSSAIDNVSMPLVFAGVKKSARKTLAQRALARVGLENRAAHYPNELSGGEQQRVAIARAIVTNPTILLADEPTGNLDQKTGQSIMKTFLQMTVDGITVIFVTHDQHLQQMADRSFHIVDARLSEEAGR